MPISTPILMPTQRPTTSSLRPFTLACALACTAGNAQGCASDPQGDAADDSSGGSGTTAGTTIGTDASEGSSGSAATTVSSATATTATSATSDDSGSDGDSSTGTPVELTPMFVAIGDGGWTASSCDRGRTWTTHEFSDEQGDHTQWTGFGGLAYGPGGFVAGFGWGAEGGHILHAADGLSWEDLPSDSFVDDGAAIGYGIYTSGVAVLPSSFMIFSQRVWRSTNGIDWVTVDVSLPPGAEQLRQLRGFPDSGLLVASVESQSGNQHPMGNFVVVSDDEGATWTEGTGFDTNCAWPIQHSGDIEMIGDTLLVGAGDVCRSPDRGLTWEVYVQPTGGGIQDLGHDDDGFIAAAGTALAQSADGVTWTTKGDVGTQLRAVAFADGVYAGITSPGAAPWYSDDGVTWQAGELDTPVVGDLWIRDFAGVMIEGACGG